MPQKAVCQLSGALMHDPVSTPDGYLFERAAIEAESKSFNDLNMCLFLRGRFRVL